MNGIGEFGYRFFVAFSFEEGIPFFFQLDSTLRRGHVARGEGGNKAPKKSLRDLYNLAV